MIKIFRTFLWATALVLATAASAMNNNDVIKMVKAELDDDTVVLAINAASPAEFDVSANSLVELKNQGVSKPVIQAIIKKQSGGSAAEDSDDAEESHASITFNAVDDSAVLPPDIEPAAGKEYFTRYTFKYEEDTRLATNYWRGETVPINTKVVLESIGKKSFNLKFVDSGKTLKVENVEKHTKRSTAQLAKEMLSSQPTAIEKYGKDMADAISSGTLRLGMTKTQVLLTRGYPPGHETPSLDAPVWKYWSSRFVTHSLAFDGDILKDGRGLY